MRRIAEMKINIAEMKLKTARIIWLLGAFALTNSGNALGAAIGASESTARVGVGVTLNTLSVEDPNGDTSNETALQPFNLVYSDDFSLGVRYWAEGFYQVATLPASSNQIGQDIERYGLRLSLQRKLKIFPKFGLWGGLGVHAAMDDFSKRYTKDGEGYLLQRYGDRSSNHFGIQGELVAEWKLKPRWDLAAKAMYAIPFGDGVNDFSVGAFFLYSY